MGFICWVVLGACCQSRPQGCWGGRPEASVERLVEAIETEAEKVSVAPA